MLLAYSLEICHGLFKNLQNILLQVIIRTVRTTMMQSSECVISDVMPCMSPAAGMTLSCIHGVTSSGVLARPALVKGSLWSMSLRAVNNARWSPSSSFCHNANGQPY